MRPSLTPRAQKKSVASVLRTHEPVGVKKTRQSETRPLIFKTIYKNNGTQKSSLPQFPWSLGFGWCSWKRVWLQNSRVQSYKSAFIQENRVQRQLTLLIATVTRSPRLIERCPKAAGYEWNHPSFLPPLSLSPFGVDGDGGVGPGSKKSAIRIQDHAKYCPI